MRRGTQTGVLFCGILYNMRVDGKKKNMIIFLHKSTAYEADLFEKKNL